MLSKLKSAITSALYFSLLIISFYDGVERLPKYDEFKSKMREMPQMRTFGKWRSKHVCTLQLCVAAYFASKSDSICGGQDWQGMSRRLVPVMAYLLEQHSTMNQGLNKSQMERSLQEAQKFIQIYEVVQPVTTVHPTWRLTAIFPM